MGRLKGPKRGGGWEAERQIPSSKELLGPHCTPGALPGTSPEHLPKAGVDFPVDGLRQGVVDVDPEEGAGGVGPLLQAHGLQGAVVALVPVAALRDGRHRP